MVKNVKELLKEKCYRNFKICLENNLDKEALFWYTEYLKLLKIK